MSYPFYKTRNASKGFVLLPASRPLGPFRLDRPQNRNRTCRTTITITEVFVLQFRTLATAVENFPRNYIKIEENKAIQNRYFNFLFSIHTVSADWELFFKSRKTQFSHLIVKQNNYCLNPSKVKTFTMRANGKHKFAYFWFYDFKPKIIST